MTYKYVEFPKVVYGPDDKSVIIKSEDERPEGYSNTPGGDEAADDAVLGAGLQAAADAAATADAARVPALESDAERMTSAIAEVARAEDAEKEEARKVEIRAFLDKHSVAYSSRLGIVKLEELFTQLTNHLKDETAAADVEADQKRHEELAATVAKANAVEGSVEDADKNDDSN